MAVPGLRYFDYIPKILRVIKSLYFGLAQQECRTSVAIATQCDSWVAKVSQCDGLPV